MFIEGWVCPCGEAYVPGAQARAAYLRAFHQEDGSDVSDPAPR